MKTILVKGGSTLNGTVTPVPNKNSVIKIIPAIILADEPVILHNVPNTSSVNIFIEVFKQLGGKVEKIGDNSYRFDSSSINSYKIDDKLADKERATFVFLGPLLSRFGKAEINNPGGCKLGNRPLDTLFQGLQSMNVTVSKENYYRLETTKLKPLLEPIWLLEASVTGTENLILAAVKAKGTTIIYNAACEPHTQELCRFLNSIGAKIEGISTNKLIITGVDRLKGGEWTIEPDHIDVGGWIVAAAITRGELRIKNTKPQNLTQILNYFSKLNLNYQIDADDILVPSSQNLICRKNIRGDIDKIQDQPWPGFPVDLIPQAIALAIQAESSIKIYSNMYESQLYFVEELQKLGASIIIAHPHMVITFGPSKLKGTKVQSPNIIQCAHSILISALTANGDTIIENIDPLYRRYPDLIQKLVSLGAQIYEIK